MGAPDLRLGGKGHPRHVWLNVTSSPEWASPGLELFTREVPTSHGSRTEAWIVSASVERPGGALRVRQGWARAEHVKDDGPPPSPRDPRHVCVRLGSDTGSVHPGLLLFWWDVPTIDGRQWLAWVVWAAGGGFHEVEVQQGWLRAEQLRPSDPGSARSPGTARREATTRGPFAR